MSEEKPWWWRLGKGVIPGLLRGGMGAYIDHLRDQFRQGLVDPDFLEGIATLLEEGARAIRQIYGATGDAFMDQVRRKAKIQEVVDVEVRDAKRPPARGSDDRQA